ncbi:MAG: capsular biosynthesis protein [Armatimonadetes bacterium]|nr:capsular biosynthesis protein [Armatimonadota bacterium]
MAEGYTFIVDIDGTLCPIKAKDQHYKDLVPYPSMVEKLRKLREQGAKIVLYTSRNMNTYGGNLGQINLNTARVLLDWIDKWEIPCDELLYGKPWPGHNGYYVDDRTIRPKEFLELELNEFEGVVERDRCKE